MGESISGNSNKDPKDAIHLAAQRNQNLKIVKHLNEQSKSDPNCFNDQGERPMDVPGDKEIKEVQ